MTNTGTGTYTEAYDPPMAIPGPAILKLSGVGSAADLDAAGGFDLILIDN